LLELRHLGVGPSAFARGALRILLTLVGERGEAGADRALDFGAFLCSAMMDAASSSSAGFG
jgi:hypothetical protein